MHCELCGKKTKLFKAIVESTELTVCASCGQYGKILKPARQDVQKNKKTKPKIVSETVETIVPDYAKRIREARQKRGMPQKDFAKLLSIKESLLHKLENGSIEPSLVLAKKLERELRISLVTQETISERTKSKNEKSSTNTLTIGDIIKL